MRKEENISENEIRVIGGYDSHANSKISAKLIAIVASVLVAIGVLTWILWPKSQGDESNPDVFEQEQIGILQHPLQQWLLSLDSIETVKVATKDTVVNDIPLHIYVPLNRIPHIEVGRSIANNREETLLFFEAADVRADNGKIVGAFVQNGKPLSWGLSKRGFCAIIDSIVTVGVADNSPLFEEATEKGGDFFRQYPLVDKGILVENELKNKSIRRALCDIDNHIAVVETQTRESLHDFAQALIDIGTVNAIYLVGGDAMGWFLDEDGNGYEIGDWSNRKHKNISFIVWTK